MEFRIVKEKGKYYIEKKILFWWAKVVDTGFGWELKHMQSIEGTRDKKVCERILKEHYLKIDN